MRLVLHKKTSTKVRARLKNRVRIRRKLTGTAERPRMCVFRSLKHLYVQIVDDTQGTTLAAASTKTDLKAKNVNLESAKQLGKAIAKKALEKNIKSVVFDRSGYIYHGRVKSLADSAREAGLSF